MEDRGEDGLIQSTQNRTPMVSRSSHTKRAWLMAIRLMLNCGNNIRRSGRRGQHREASTYLIRDLGDLIVMKKRARNASWSTAFARSASACNCICSARWRVRCSGSPGAACCCAQAQNTGATWAVAGEFLGWAMPILYPVGASAKLA
jgi:hypothetical protein